VQRAVSAQLQADRDRVCALRELAPSEPLLEPPPYAGRRAPPRSDPFSLDEICIEVPPAPPATTPVGEAGTGAAADTARSVQRQTRRLREALGDALRRPRP